MDLTKLHLEIFKTLKIFKQRENTFIELAYSMFQQETKDITWQFHDIAELERSIKFAKLQNKEVFTFQTQNDDRIELVTDYAEYLLEYLKTRFK